MILLGAFRKFDLVKNPLAAVFIFSGEWEVSLHPKLDPHYHVLLAKGKTFFKKIPGKIEFYTEGVSLEVIRSGVCQRVLLGQGPFKILLNAGTWNSELNLATLNLVAGSRVKIEYLHLRFGGENGS